MENLDEKAAKQHEDFIINQIIATHKLEGLEVEQCVLNDIKRIIKKEITAEQAIKKAFARIKNEQIQWNK